MSWVQDLDQYRGTGRSTRQMEAAPVGAVYLVGNQNELDYARRLAKKVGRTDLSIFTTSYLEDRWRGQEITDLVVDHYAQGRLTDRQWDLCCVIRQHLVRK